VIAGIQGGLVGKSPDALLVDVGGVIYRALTSGRTLADAGEPGDPVALHTHLVVREDALLLYGFLTVAELNWFETLIGVSGVGPRLACAILTRMAPDTLLDAIANEQVSLLATVPGVGRKTAARLILDLRGKLPQEITVSTGVPRGDDPEVVEALQALGYSPIEARSAVGRAGVESGIPVEDRLVAALRELGR
jgi:Holliday junction DNA helicase RuvA